MFTDVTDLIKGGVIIHLSENARLTQFVPAARIFGLQAPANPAYPYLKFGTPIITPFVASCWAGTALRLTLDAYAQSEPGGEAGETQLGRIVKLVVEAMNDLRLEGADIVDNSYLGARLSMVESEADRWRAIIEYNVTAVISAS